MQTVALVISRVTQHCISDRHDNRHHIQDIRAIESVVEAGIGFTLSYFKKRNQAMTRKELKIDAALSSQQ